MAVSVDRPQLLDIVLAKPRFRNTMLCIHLCLQGRAKTWALQAGFQTNTSFTVFASRLMDEFPYTPTPMHALFRPTPAHQEPLPEIPSYSPDQPQLSIFTNETHAHMAYRQCPPTPASTVSIVISDDEDPILCKEVATPTPTQATTKPSSPQSPIPEVPAARPTPPVPAEALPELSTDLLTRLLPFIMPQPTSPTPSTSSSAVLAGLADPDPAFWQNVEEELQVAETPSPTIENLATIVTDIQVSTTPPPPAAPEPSRRKATQPAKPPTPPQRLASMVGLKLPIKKLKEKIDDRRHRDRRGSVRTVYDRRQRHRHRHGRKGRSFGDDLRRADR